MPIRKQARCACGRRKFFSTIGRIRLAPCHHPPPAKRDRRYRSVSGVAPLRDGSICAENIPAAVIARLVAPGVELALLTTGIKTADFKSRWNSRPHTVRQTALGRGLTRASHPLV
jgi:hypothetical protein